MDSGHTWRGAVLQYLLSNKVTGNQRLTEFKISLILLVINDVNRIAEETDITRQDLGKTFFSFFKVGISHLLTNEKSTLWSRIYHIYRYLGEIKIVYIK